MERVPRQTQRSMNTFHTPVLLEEVLTALDIQKGKKYIDATLGGAGHSEEIVKRGGSVLGIDADTSALEEARKRLGTIVTKSDAGENWRIVQGNFRDIERIAKENGFDVVDGILFDLGVSSYQIDRPEKGFSYRFDDAPLDLRFSSNQKITAAEIINTYSEEDLYEIFTKFGEEQRSRAIAHAIVRARSVEQLHTASELKRVISTVVTNNIAMIKVLSRIFQALRIEVNDELHALTVALEAASRLIRPQGTLAVISYHSLEDRIVKRQTKTHSWRTVGPMPIYPTEQEIRLNSRSRSAKLRVAIKQ